MMDDDALLAEVPALLQQQSCEQCCGGGITEALGEGTS